MKKLFYLSALSGLILLAASCNKGELVGPQKPIDTSKNPGPKPPACESVKQITYVLKNSTGNSTYEISFRGSQNYIFSFPPYGDKTVYVNPGTYSIYVFTPNFDDYQNESFQMNNLAPVIGSGAHYDGVILTSCTVPQSVSITL
ncbi:MAG TPA: hypothetical protein VGI43_03310 [Mucilaginibacter sp.]|jgi:hypothetical protein